MEKTIYHPSQKQCSLTRSNPTQKGEYSDARHYDTQQYAVPESTLGHSRCTTSTVPSGSIASSSGKGHPQLKRVESTVICKEYGRLYVLYVTRFDDDHRRY